jgi:fumarylacetoacetate (FAA) hydrolase family protein
MHALEIFDTRTLEKHLKHNFPNSPLMNVNVKEIIQDFNPELKDKDLYRKVKRADVTRISGIKEKMKNQNAKFNNLKNKADEKNIYK